MRCVRKREQESISDAAFFDVVSCQFAYHYSFSDKETVHCAIRNVSRLLCRGGKFLLTIPDAEVIYRRLRKASGMSFGNELYRVTFEDKTNFYKYGQKYTFYLEDAIDNCPEYMVPLQTLIDVAKGVDLEVVYAENFEKMFCDYRHAHRHLLQRMRIDPDEPLTPQEKEAATLYMGIVFQKVETAQKKPTVETCEKNPNAAPNLCSADAL